MAKYFEGMAGFIARQIINATDTFELTYKQGKGHFNINMYLLITSFNQKDFKKVAEMIKTSENPKVIAGYLNSIIKKIYTEVQAMQEKSDKADDDLNNAMDFMKKKNDILVKAFEVSPLTEVKQDTPVENNENITALKKCNVIRYIPTQVKPIWENGVIENHIGYHFEYRGMPLQAYTNDGWCNKKLVTTIFIIDPVIGLPITHYTGALCEIEDRLSQVFIGYLKTIESNKESIVQIATAFNKLKTA